MDAGKTYGRCTVCNGTMSVHINVGRPLDHAFGYPAKNSSDGGSKHG